MIARVLDGDVANAVGEEAFEGLVPVAEPIGKGVVTSAGPLDADRWTRLEAFKHRQDEEATLPPLLVKGQPGIEQHAEINHHPTGQTGGSGGNHQRFWGGAGRRIIQDWL